MTSAVPQIEFTEAGLVIPTEAELLTGVLTDMDTAFGGGLNQSLETPQGQLASSQAAVIADKNAEIATVVNQVDPQYSDGRFQDAIARIYFLTRKPATSTAVVCTLVGLNGTLVPAGTLAQDTSGNTYALTGDTTIPIGGSIDAEFQNLIPGPIPCAADTLTRVYQAVPGWDAITNDDAGTLGQEVESRADFELRRRNSVALNGRSSVNAIYAAVFEVDNVLDCYVTENTTSVPLDVGSTDYELVPHSVYVAVVGGMDDDVAQAIWTKKDLGCDYNGNTTVTVNDTSGYNYPYPQYEVKFERPDTLALVFAVEIVNDPTLPSDIVERVKLAIMARFNGTDGTGRERIGALVLASRYYGAVSASAPGLGLLSILIGTVSPTLTQVPVGIDQRPTLDAADISVSLV